MADQDVGRTGNFEIIAIIQTVSKDGNVVEEYEEIPLHSKQNGHSRRERFAKPTEEQAALVDKIENFLLRRYKS